MTERIAYCTIAPIAQVAKMTIRSFVRLLIVPAFSRFNASSLICVRVFSSAVRRLELALAGKLPLTVECPLTARFALAAGLPFVRSGLARLFGF